MHATLQNVDHRFVAEEAAAFRVGDFACVKKKHGVGFARIDVQRAGLVRVAEHLHDAREIVVREAAAEAGVRLRQHLRRLKSFRFADDDALDVRGDRRWRGLAVDVVVATGLKSFHQCALAPVAQGDDLESSVLRIRVNDFGNLESAHLAHVRGTKNRGWNVILDRRQRIGRLRTRNDFEALAFQRIAKPLCEVHVAVDQQNFWPASRKLTAWPPQQRQVRSDGDILPRRA